jgi:CRISPR-associated protein Csb1
VNETKPSAAPHLVTEEDIDTWAADSSDMVALHLKQKLVPVEGEGAVIFPPTYADIGYLIHPLI